MGLLRPGRALGSVRGSYLVALAVLATGLALTAVSYRIVRSNEAAARQARFTQYAAQAANTVEARFSQYLSVLDSSAGLFASGQRVTRAGWAEFGAAIDISRNYPGISNLQSLSYVPAAELPRFLAATRADGAPDFKLNQQGLRPFYCPITYSVPDEKGAEGFDPCQISRRGTDVLMRARDVSGAMLSAPLDLRDLQNHNHRGVVAVRALYRAGADVSSADGRRAALFGWVAETLPIDQIMAGVIPADMSIAVSIRDADLPGPTGAIYDDGTYAAGVAPQSGGFGRIQPAYASALNIGGRHWALDFSEPPSVAWFSLMILLAGLMVSLPLTLLVLNLGLTRSRALRLAARMTESLREQQQLLSSITGNISDGIYRSTPDKGMIYANDALARMFGYTSAAELMSVAGPILYANPRRRQELEKLLDEKGQYHNEEVEYQRKDGSRFFGANSAITVKDAAGMPLYFDGVIADITDRKRAERQVYQLAHYDNLTGLPNRALLRDRLGQAISDAKRREARLAVLFLDLDRFKTVNDSLGHETGDKLLQAVAARLRDAMRDSDTISRQGGDEFLLILRDVADAHGVAHFAEKLLEVVARPYTIAEYELHVTPSIGISLFPDDAADLEALIRNADAAMYQAKENGRNAYQFYTQEMNTRAYERLSLESSLRLAIHHQEFSLHYQPQLDLRTGSIVCAEALLRWQRPGKPEVNPAVFVPVLESSGLIGEVGEWVLREACRQNRAWQQQGLPKMPVAVNLSAIQFNRRNMADMIAAILAETGLEAKYLELEFTESAVMRDTRDVGDTIRRLDELGVRLALDDFGTGYSSLSYLRRFHLDKIKIDQSFVRDLNLDPDDAAITVAIIGMAQDLKVAVVAEGVETREQGEFLRQHGCDAVQGFYFSRPLTAEAYAALLQSGTKLRL